MNVFKSTIGDIEVIRIVEVEIGSVLQSIIKGAAPDSIRQMPWLYPKYADAEGVLKGVVQSFLLRLPHRTVIIDTCIGNDKRRVDIPEWGLLQTDYLSLLESVGCAPESVTDVICTHLHMDHVGWNTILRGGRWEPTFPNARYYFAKDEYAYWVKKPSREIADDLASFDDSITPIFAAGLATLVNVDEDLGNGITLVATPGHTPAHVSISLRTGAYTVLFSGDAIHHPCQISKPNWSTESDFSCEQAAISRKILLAKASAPKHLLAGSHFAEPSIGQIRRRKDGSFRFYGVADAR